MSKQRMIDPKLWSDQWVRKLNPLDRYLFIYLLTNERSSWCGVYELDLGVMAFESGIDERDLEKSMLPRLSPKVLYVDGWVCFRNWDKYHNNGSEQTKKGIENAWEAVPEKIRLKISKLLKISRPPIDPLQGRSSLTSSSSSSFTSTSILQSKTIAEPDDVEIVPEEKPKTPKKKDYKKYDDETPFTLGEFVASMEASPQRHVKIIGMYADTKQIKNSTKGQWRLFTDRNVASARRLSPYSDEQIALAFREIEKNMKGSENRKGYITRWTLETIEKYLEEI